ncbi:MAG: protoporphyrinogen oxidase, partial [Elusimicrobia bacterium]|nr:protoporphyrinogen oxidase [Elusimicrobiota bacterium]
RRRAPPPRPGSRVTMFMALDGGLSGLVSALAERLPEGAVRLGTPAESLERAGAGWRVRAGGETLEADAVVLALPAHAAAALARPLDAPLAEDLGAIPFVSTATATLSYPRGAWGGRLKGFGFVVDRREARAVVAGTYSASKFPGRAPEGVDVLRLFLGGAGREDVVGWDDARILAAVREDLRRLLGADPEPEAARVYRWPRSNPQYNVGHRALVSRLERAVAGLPGLLLAGSSYKGVGIPDCIRSGREAARRVLADGPAAGSVV